MCSSKAQWYFETCGFDQAGFAVDGEQSETEDERLINMCIPSIGAAHHHPSQPRPAHPCPSTAKPPITLLPIPRPLPSTINLEPPPKLQAPSNPYPAPNRQLRQPRRTIPPPDLEAERRQQKEGGWPWRYRPATRYQKRASKGRKSLGIQRRCLRRRNSRCGTCITRMCGKSARRR